MPEKGDKGWRKIKHATRPKTPLQSKPATTPLDGDTNARRHFQPLDKPEKIGWRKTIQGTRPETSVGTGTGGSVSTAKLAPADEDVEDTRSEYASEISASTPRRRSVPRPAMLKYLSGYRALTQKEEIFSEPWNDNVPKALITQASVDSRWLPFVKDYTDVISHKQIDSIVVLQAIHSHLCNHFHKPIPPEHHSGLLQVFEDYRRLREQKEKLEALLKDTLTGYKSAEDSWTTEEDRYQAEIRRLELLIARGTTGMTGLMAARKESVIKRSRPHGKMLLTDRFVTAYENCLPEVLDEQIKLKSQRVHLHRPSSPSGKMAALSSHFSSNSSSKYMVVGTPPSRENKAYGTFSQRVKSELDLANMANMNTLNSLSQSDYSEFSESGDPLPDEIEALNAKFQDARVECEAFVALQDLGTLVAQRRGINAERFVKKLMLLFSDEDSNEMDPGSFGAEEDTSKSAAVNNHEDRSDLTPQHYLRHIQSQPHLSSDQRSQRHFSFEPGDDQPGALEEKPTPYKSQMDSYPSLSVPSNLRDALSNPQAEASSNQPQTLNAEFQKLCKISSPVQEPTLEHVRPKNSVSSLQSVPARLCLDDRRDSRSSVVTAIRESSGSLRIQSTSRSGSINNLRQAEGHRQIEKNRSPRPQNSAFALAAARAADDASSAALKSSSPTRRKTRASRASENVKSENDVPEKCS